MAISAPFDPRKDYYKQRGERMAEFREIMGAIPEASQDPTEEQIELANELAQEGEQIFTDFVAFYRRVRAYESRTQGLIDQYDDPTAADDFTFSTEPPTWAEAAMHAYGRIPASDLLKQAFPFAVRAEVRDIIKEQ